MISVLTATIEGREHFLEKAKESVQAQTFKDFEHLIYKDVDKKGNWFSYNELIKQAKGKYITFLDDDDTLQENHLQELYNHKDKADIIYNLGNIDDPRKDKKYVWYNEPYDRQLMRIYNYVPITALVSAKLAKANLMQPRQDCDFIFWKKLIFENRCTVYQNKVVTWNYNFHSSNGSFA